MNKKIIILNIVQDFNTGGIQRLLLNYAEYHKNSNEVDYRILVLDSKLNNKFEKEAEENNINISFFNYHCFKYEEGNKKYTRYNSYNNFKLTRYIKKMHPDIIHTHNTRMLNLIKKSLIKLSKQYCIFHSLHSDPYFVPEKYVDTLNELVNKQIIIPVCLNDAQKNKAIKRYKTEFKYIIFNSIKINKFSNCSINKAKMLTELGVTPTDYIVGAVGRLEMIKNLHFLLDCFEKVREKEENCTLIIFGEGSEYNSLQEKINRNKLLKNKVFIFKIRNDIEKMYKLFDVFVCCSLSEGTPLVLVEAQAAGCKCVIDNNIPNDSICTNKVKVLSLNDSLDAWASSILNPSEFNNPITKLVDYDISVVQNKLLSLYKTQLSAKKN